ncbi:MAG: hypothetical protein IT287_07625 [Bdellovibrionaceae bacterium]|nr:hypothetical protein [Pseudobdellovibrionaceae bacterium]
MKILTGSILLSLTMWISPAYSQTDQRTISPSEMFTTALQKFKTKDYVQSRQMFSQLLSAHPNDTALLYNVGLVEATDNHPERAFAYWRKALFLSPGHGPSLEGISSLKPGVVSYSFPLWIYWRVPIAVLSILAFLFWCLSAALIVRNIRRNSQQKPVRWDVSALCGILFLLFTTLAIHDYVVLFSVPSATLMANTPAQASPANDAPSLFDFKEGDDVHVLRAQNGWLHVQKSETAVGWVKSTALLIHSGI